ncbi:MAG: O-antigen ligase family protein [Caldisericaceae bacterium]
MEKTQIKKVLSYLVVIFLFIAGEISKYSELIFIEHSYLFALGIIVIFLIFVGVLFSGERLVHAFTFSPLLIAFVFSFLFLIPFSILKYYSIMETYRIVAPVLLFVVMINTIRTKDDRNFYAYALVAFGMAIGILSYIDYYDTEFGILFDAIFHTHFFDTIAVNPNEWVALSSIWGYQNTFAAFLVLQIYVSFGIYLNLKRTKQKFLFSFVPMFFIFLLFLTVSRGGYIALIVGGIAFLIVFKGRVKEVLKELLPVLIGAFLLILFASPKEIIYANIGKTNILIKFVSGVSSNTSLWDRVHLIDLATRIFLKRPLVGFGLGTFRFTFAINEWVGESFRIDPHSLVFKLLAETGLIGTIAFFSFVGFILLKGFITSTKSDDVILKGLVAGAIGLVFHMCLDVDIYPIMFIVLFYVLSLLVEPNFITFSAQKRFTVFACSFMLLFVAIFDLFPKTVASRYAVMGEGVFLRKETESAINLMEKAVTYDQKNSTYYFYLGELQSRLLWNKPNETEFYKMIESFKKSFSLNRYDYRPVYKLGLYTLPERTETALNYLIEGDLLYPTNSEIQSWLSIAYFYIGKDCSKATLHFDKAQEYNYRNINLTLAEGVYELCKGNKDLAKTLLTRLLSLTSGKSNTPHTFSTNTFDIKEKIISDLLKELPN